LNRILHHVGIVVPSEAEMAEMMATLGLSEDYRGYVPEFSSLCVFTHGHGASPVEFVVPTDGPLVKFNKGFGGLHHLAYLTNDLTALARDFAAKGMKMLMPDPVKGAGNFFCNFLSPIYTRGIAIEYVQLIDGE
jgi:methylmalonyl-CoA/ethylmalonyl-CoA epimerase